ncbi:MAG: hypothetical protein FWD68_18250 [Alphaproteobacteria bacterium]|nr:hypothetical protein [Alphaproteobacteria bacterium]
MSPYACGGWCPFAPHWREEGGAADVEGVGAVAAGKLEEVDLAWRRERIAVVQQSRWGEIGGLKPDVVIDAIIAKHKIATEIDDARLVIAPRPGFTAGRESRL